MLKSLHNCQNEVFLQLLRGRRQAIRLRQSDLALRLGSGQATVSKVERGTRRLDVIELRAWLVALDMDFVSFVGELDRQLQKQPVVGPIVRLVDKARGSIPAGGDGTIAKDV